ncbi:MAG: type II secretion system F family protein [Candidatus Parcubacteria bacterium]|nr:type II secretion system F family protein [Burkholderiales bacterium]
MATAAAAKGGPKEFTFLWEGKDKGGKVVRGEMRAAGENMVMASLRRQGIVVNKVKKQRIGSGGSVSEKDVALFTRQMATMMKAGVPLLQAFDIVSKGATNPAVARLLIDIKTEVETGSSLAQAFRKYPLHFDALYCNLVAAGEAAGILEQLLERLAIYKEKTLAIKSKIKSALFYPVSIIVVAIVITAVIMIFVIPAFKSVFASFGADLPAPTLIVMGISDWTVSNWYIVFPAMGGAVYGFLEAWKRSLAVQIFMDRISLKMPIFGSLLRKASIARWTRTLSTMFAAGVPLVEALDSVGGASGNYVYLEATIKIKQEVSTGTALTVAMQNANVFPSMVLQMCMIGEETGALDAMLGKVADFFEAEVDDAVDALSSLMEPIIMVVLGTLIGGMVVAMYLPIFKLGGAV